ncbi:hypothetical protein H6G81_11435 [Scytonema hofmannii FACHB-248]|uniref:Uncharacterized protein n=1 Tax=Scytonema hofmannii FACHB-248 TaxID=1842502 RepID=A0ABR8GNX7_9CYAN|nr:MULTISPECIES: hypothetical protein [Nostocales]MBD2605126.1 hypothetical protein [Scytonema hofmannii FACHB-248]
MVLDKAYLNSDDVYLPFVMRSQTSQDILVMVSEGTYAGGRRQKATHPYS